MSLRTTLVAAATCAAVLAPAASAAAAPAGTAAGPVAASASTTSSTTAVSVGATNDQVAPPGITRRLDGAAASQYLRGRTSGMVIDSGTGSVVWSRDAGVARMPASTQKVVTAHTVLSSMAPDARLTTAVHQNRANRGVLYLKGGGDPSLTSARLKTLADRTAAQLRSQRRTSVTVWADASVFPAPTNATGWRASYLTGRHVQPVRGLTLAGHRSGDGSLAAARTFAAHLRAAGITTTVRSHARTPGASTRLADTASAPVSQLVARMLAVSDNDYAEYLLRHAAISAGLSPTWQNSLAHQRRTLERSRVPVRGYVGADGSGLSRSNRMPVATLTATIERLWSDPVTRQVAFAPGAMPRSGESGTLRTRFAAPAQRCARGQVAAKTGTLADAVSLAGVAQGSDGRIRVFAFVQNGSGSAASVRGALDSLATAVVDCR